MTRECQVRICERLEVKFPGPTRPMGGHGRVRDGKVTRLRRASVRRLGRARATRDRLILPWSKTGRKHSGETQGERSGEPGPQPDRDVRLDTRCLCLTQRGPSFVLTPAGVSRPPGVKTHQRARQRAVAMPARAHRVGKGSCPSACHCLSAGASARATVD
jgi:hypothetical protein